MWMDTWVLNRPFRTWEKPFGRPEHHRVLYRFFESLRPLVVLSSSNLAQRETFEQKCNMLNVPIVQRRGGGGTVVLGPGCLVLTFAFFAKDVFSNQKYFSIINSLWADALSNVGISNIHMRGHSDLAHGDQKIAGTSLFRRKHLVVFQGSLLVDPDFALIVDLLQHPSREPDYRQGRSHLDFLTSAARLGYSGTATMLGKQCSEFFKHHVYERLECEFADPGSIPLHQATTGGRY